MAVIRHVIMGCAPTWGIRPGRLSGVKEAHMAKHKPPQVPKKGGGTQERDRNKDGRWRDKRSDAGKKRK